jgi:putative ubiquitin-RnfH superfamily antitoxin RatB of RatAB toxin-antitoxin module
MIRVEVVYCARPGHADRSELALADGATVADALRASGVVERCGLEPERVALGVWGRKRDLSSPLRDRDRVEVYRPLVVDPKEARRLRCRKDRAVSGSRTR